MSNRDLLWWKKVWDEIYEDADFVEDKSLNTAGWKSSYTNKMISPIEMQEFANNISSRILALSPINVLEIGCGSGMVLFRVAPKCISYWGTDISQTALDYVAEVIAQYRPHLDGITLQNREANDFSALLNDRFDTVILNSVIQYFSSEDYLKSVLVQSLNLIKQGGHVVIGDVRSASLTELFQLSVEFHWAKDNMPIAQLKQRVQKYIDDEKELLVDPQFFFNLQEAHPQISNVEIQLKRGKARNEMTLFRYDVIIHTDSAYQIGTKYQNRDWLNSPFDLLSVEELLSENTEAVRLTRILNSRHAQVVEVARIIKDESCEYESVGDVRRHLKKGPVDGIDPEQIWLLGEKWGYKTEVFWSISGDNGYYDALLIKD